MSESRATLERRTIEPEAISPAMFAHFVLTTSNPDAMREWYRTLLNARIVFENDLLCFLTYDDEHHRLALLKVPGLQAPAKQAWGLSHVAYTYNTLRDLLSTYRRLKNAGILPARPINHGPTVSMYYRDPDGNAVELQVDAFSTKAEAAGYFHSAAFGENPIGVLFDPEELIRRYEAGESEEDLVKRPSGPAARPLG